MVIIPTEKKFDWQHAPVVLLSIVVLNILIFFIYQSGDIVKSQKALESYKSNNYIEQEWPAYQKYLEFKGQTKRLNALRARQAALREDSFLFEIMSDVSFYHYLENNGRKIFSQSYYEAWRTGRELINRQVSSLSWLAGGLRASHFNLANLFSHQFLHGDVMHLLGNLFFLAVCGFAVEAALGHWRFLALYLLSGAFSGIAQILVVTEGALIGASGAISGVMAMYLGIFRFKRIEFFYWIFLFVGYFRAPALLILPAYILKEIVMFFSSSGSSIAFVAHAGGFVFGSVAVAGLIHFRPLLLNQQYLEDADAIDARRQSLTDIYQAIEKYQFITAKNRVEEMLNHYGSDFELENLRYSLLRLSNDKNAVEAAKAVLLVSKLSPFELRKVELIWNQVRHQDIQLSDEEKMNLGLRLVNRPEPSSAAEIFDDLYEAGFQHALMGVFAKKLAQAFESLKQKGQQKHYQKLSEALLGLKV